MIPNRATHHICSLKKSHPKIFWTHQLPMRKNCEPMKYLREKMLDPWNNHKKALDPRITPEKKVWTHEIPTKKNSETTKYLREKYFGLTKAPWHDGTRPTEFSTLVIYAD